VSLVLPGVSVFPANSKSPVAKTTYGARHYNKVVALGNHNDAKVDELILAAQAEAKRRKLLTTKWKAMTEYLQVRGIHHSYSSLLVPHLCE
jgi:hypothetical protein